MNENNTTRGTAATLRPDFDGIAMRAKALLAWYDVDLPDDDGTLKSIAAARVSLESDMLHVADAIQTAMDDVEHLLAYAVWLETRARYVVTLPDIASRYACRIPGCGREGHDGFCDLVKIHPPPHMAGCDEIHPPYTACSTAPIRQGKP